MQDGSLFHADDSDIETVFGKPMNFYVHLCRRICPLVLNTTYYFEDLDTFENKARNGQYSIQRINEIYCRELLFRYHISVVSSLLRTCRLMDATAREYGAYNLPGWASCARALLESTGDSIDVLQYIPTTIFENYHCMNRCILGKEDRGFYSAKELEEKLIEFSHARKPERGEQVPDTHIAKSTRCYIKSLEKFKIGDVASLYKKLCELSHPAAASVQYMFSPKEDGKSFCISDKNDQLVLDLILEGNCSGPLGGIWRLVSDRRCGVAQESDLYGGERVVSRIAH